MRIENIKPYKFSLITPDRIKYTDNTTHINIIFSLLEENKLPEYKNLYNTIIEKPFMKDNILNKILAALLDRGWIRMIEGGENRIYIHVHNMYSIHKLKKQNLLPMYPENISKNIDVYIDCNSDRYKLTLSEFHTEKISRKHKLPY